MSLDGAGLMPLLSTISRAELDHEATLAATRLGKPFEKPGPSIREGLDYIDFRGDGVLHVRIADWYRARAKRDHARMKQMELDTENSTSIRADGMPGISDTIQHVLQRCTAVTDVSIRHSTLTNTALNSICQLMRGRLLSLDLHGTKGFTDVGIKALAAYCSQIQTLRLGGGCAVSASGLGESARGWNLT